MKMISLTSPRPIGAVFRRGGDVVFVAEELKAVFDPRGGTHRSLHLGDIESRLTRN